MKRTLNFMGHLFKILDNYMNSKYIARVLRNSLNRKPLANCTKLQVRFETTLEEVLLPLHIKQSTLVQHFINPEKWFEPVK